MWDDGATACSVESTASSSPSRFPRIGSREEVRTRIANFLFWGRRESPVLKRALDIAASRLTSLHGKPGNGSNPGSGSGNLHRYSNSEYAIIYSSGPDVLSEAAMRLPGGKDLSGRLTPDGRAKTVDGETVLVPLLDFAPFVTHGHAATWEGEGNAAVVGPGSGDGVKGDKRRLSEEPKKYTLRLGRFTVKVDSLEELLSTFTASLATETIGGGLYYYLRTAIRKLKETSITAAAPASGERSLFGAARAAGSGTAEEDQVDNKWFVPHLVAAYTELSRHDQDVPGRSRHELGKVFKSLGMPDEALEALDAALRELEAVSSSFTYPELHDLWHDIAQMHLFTVKDESSLLSVPAIDSAVEAFQKAITHAPPAPKAKTKKGAKPPVSDRYKRSLAVALELRNRLPPAVDQKKNSDSKSEGFRRDL